MFIERRIYRLGTVAAGPPTAEELKKLKVVAFSSPVKAPDFVLRNLQRKEVRLDVFRGKPLLVTIGLPGNPIVRGSCPLFAVYTKRLNKVDYRSC